MKMGKYIVKKYIQTRREQPRVVEAREFSTFEEAERFFNLVKRAGNWPWEFWSYPEEAKA
jgi:hypothetical protein